jgi:hypothetical protein
LYLGIVEDGAIELPLFCVAVATVVEAFDVVRLELQR